MINLKVGPTRHSGHPVRTCSLSRPPDSLTRRGQQSALLSRLDGFSPTRVHCTGSGSGFRASPTSSRLPRYSPLHLGRCARSRQDVAAPTPPARPCPLTQGREQGRGRCLRRGRGRGPEVGAEWRRDLRLTSARGAGAGRRWKFSGTPPARRAGRNPHLGPHFLACQAPTTASVSRFNWKIILPRNQLSTVSGD